MTEQEEEALEKSWNLRNEVREAEITPAMLTYINLILHNKKEGEVFPIELSGNLFVVKLIKSNHLIIGRIIIANPLLLGAQLVLFPRILRTLGKQLGTLMTVKLTSADGKTEIEVSAEDLAFISDTGLGEKQTHHNNKNKEK
jgi:hypothetical protein